MAIAYHALGKLELATNYFNYCLDVSREINRKDIQTQILIGLF